MSAIRFPAGNRAPGPSGFLGHVVAVIEMAATTAKVDGAADGHLGWNGAPFRAPRESTGEFGHRHRRVVHRGVTDASVTGDPGIRIVSPAPGDTVSGDFEVVVEVDNFELSCDLYGKPGLIGIGHYHMNLDTTDGPMMGMASMMGMGCTQTFQASTEGLESGATHTLIALLADNGHAPLMNAQPATVEVTVG